MTRVLIADDHPLFRVALKDTLSYIEADFAITEASTFDEAQKLTDDDLERQADDEADHHTALTAQ